MEGYFFEVVTKNSSEVLEVHTLSVHTQTKAFLSGILNSVLYYFERSSEKQQKRVSQPSLQTLEMQILKESWCSLFTKVHNSYLLLRSSPHLPSSHPLIPCSSSPHLLIPPPTFLCVPAAVVCGYAVDIRGVMVDAVVCEKEIARKAFETEVREKRAGILCFFQLFERQ